MSKILIEIPDDVNYENYDMPYFVLDAITSGKYIPDNATNGDMIEVMFPFIEVKREISSTSDNIVVRDNSFFGAINRFHTDWWNAPYKAESEK